MSDHAPACIIGRFGHVGFGHLGAGHIAHRDEIGTPNNFGGAFVRPVLANVLDFGVNRLDAVGFSGPLRQGQLVFVLPGEVVPALRFVSIGAGDLIGDTEVDTDAMHAEPELRFVFDFALKVDVPAASGVLREAAGFDLAEGLTREPKTERRVSP